ncbi:hypothetical protein [Pseudomonas sp. Q1-7]|uniref:hypothetical protein n=1 Tax=Pseudomonas sp. Q1-7 TaxID=3020843 RepID=UPI002300CCB8|nr:hypothetical protein [Pseudomonas sp. Q1-7]
MLALSACGLASLCLWGATEGVPENPNNPADVAGIPAFAMYVVILLFLFLVSLFCMAIVCLVERYFSNVNKSWRIIAYCFWAFPLFINSGLGLLISFAYNYGEPLGLSAISLYVLSIIFLIFSLIRFGASFAEHP